MQLLERKISYDACKLEYYITWILLSEAILLKQISVIFMHKKTAQIYKNVYECVMHWNKICGNLFLIFYC